MFARNNPPHPDDQMACLNAPNSGSSGNSLVRALRFLFVCTFAWGAVGCSKAPQRLPEAPLKQAIKADEALEQELFDTERHHLAPPPAYGNKVVMAEHDNQTRHHF